jgi:cytochrome c-type biogenesis protein CcmE
MKTIHIIGIVFVIAIIAVVITTFSDASTYVDFATAEKNQGKEFHVIGKLSLDKDIVYDAATDANKFSFYMTDDKGVEKKVTYCDVKPQDFEKSEKVVAIGKMENGEFTASSLLLKCPSKYNEDEMPEEYKDTEYSKAG